MIREMILPQLAMGNAEALIVEWMVSEGDHVARDAPLVSIETEKVVTELPAPYEGFVHIVAELESTVEIESLIAQIASTEDEYKKLIESGPGEIAVPSSTVESVIPNVDATEVDNASEARRERPTGRIKAGGVARKLARSEGIDLASITGTGPGGRIQGRDVEKAIEERESATVSAPASTATDTSDSRREKDRIPLTGMRGAIAERMMQAKLSAAQTYTFFEIDVTELLSVRDAMLAREEELGVRVSLIALQAKALAMACQHVPICNATLDGDEITIWDSVDISVAVAVPGKGDYDSGLLVPVLRNVETMDVVQISRELKDLVNRARSGELSSDDMSRHTVTLSSTAGLAAPGSWLVSSPILNLPAVTAFQPGTPKRSPVVSDDGEIVVRDILPCGLTFDHRAVDGSPIGDFTKKLTELLGNPELMLS
jgi:pyruvate dehydrogenase E2 component (dihydrolipoamide acetyltransferase)